jgi:preprotein translocase subunit SecE
MGRIQKKKDPIKKKAQLSVKDELGAVKGDGADGPASRPSLAVKKTASPDRSKAVVKDVKDPGIVQKSLQFLREVKIELKKVTWPTRKQTMGSTVVVVILVVIISLFLGLVDMGLSSLMRVVLP